MPTEAQRRSIERAMLFAPDDDLRILWEEGAARVSGCSIDVVREVMRAREERRAAFLAATIAENAAVVRRAIELARTVGFKGSPQALIVRVLDAAIERARRRKVSGDGRSAGRTMSRSRAPAEAREGTPGDRDPRLRRATGAAGAALASGMGSAPAQKRAT